MNSNAQTVNRSLFALFAAVLLACALLTSNAIADDQVRSETVKFQDLNVASQAGVEALYVRIHGAAVRVCSQPGDQWGMFRTAPCIRKAEAEAIQKVNLPLLTAYYQTKSGGQPKSLIANR
jgi:UrcA family protein